MEYEYGVSVLFDYIVDTQFNIFIDGTEELYKRRLYGFFQEYRNMITYKLCYYLEFKIKHLLSHDCENSETRSKLLKRRDEIYKRKYQEFRDAMDAIIDIQYVYEKYDMMDSLTDDSYSMFKKTVSGDEKFTAKLKSLRECACDLFHFECLSIEKLNKINIGLLNLVKFKTLDENIPPFEWLRLASVNQSFNIKNVVCELFLDYLYTETYGNLYQRYDATAFENNFAEFG
jgi:hypothetical protein